MSFSGEERGEREVKLQVLSCDLQMQDDWLTLLLDWLFQHSEDRI